MRKAIMTKIADNDVVIVGIARTAMGNLLGSLSSLSAPQLGAIAIKEALKRANVAPNQVEDLYFGNVLSANLGQSPATQASVLAGIPTNVPSTNVNKVCASGMKALMIGASQIRAGDAHVVVCGGMESMSKAPFLAPEMRTGNKYGHVRFLDAMARDGLEDAFNNEPMGNFAESFSHEIGISREEQDAYALQSYERSIAAHKGGKFKKEIVPVVFKGKGKKPDTVVEVDEEAFSRPVTKESLAGLRPAFKIPAGKVGAVTAGNASTINDGASALVLVSGAKARELKLTPLAVVRGWADAQQEPAKFLTSPALAVPKALKHAKVEMETVDFWEFNEAFSVVALANMKLLGLNSDRVNVYGGAVALGHPLGSSGSRIICTLVSVLSQEGGKIGVASICNGGGGASAVVLESVDSSRL